MNLLKIDQKTIRIKNNDQTVKEVPPSIHTLVNALPKAGPAVGEAALTLARCDLGNKDIQAPQKSLYTLLYTL